jgi:hypothetical protein
LGGIVGAVGTARCTRTRFLGKRWSAFFDAMN